MNTIEGVEELCLDDVIRLFVSFIPVGMILCFIFIIVGLSVSGIFKIFKQI